jgi:hypothetical protein
LFDTTELEDADEDDITASKSTESLPVNGANDNFVKILTSLLDSTVSTCVTYVILWCRILIQKWIVTWLVKKFIAYMEPEDL